MPAQRIHLVRHGEVSNPEHVVYADLPGFHLSELGRRQAAAAAEHLALRRVTAVVASPLDRAVETARLLAAPFGLPVASDERLTEWTLAARWRGIAWEELPARRPGELEAYLAHPDDLPFAPESLADVGRRTAGAIGDHAARLGGGELVIVSHQDPLHAARRHLTAAGYGDFGEGKPVHAGVVSLHPGPGAWQVVATWAPPQGTPFPPGDI